MHTAPKIAVSAGELSGDQHLAQVIRQLKARIPQAQVKGMGGRHLREAGVETVVDSEATGGVMGFLEVIKRLPAILHASKVMRSLLENWKPDLLIVVDYPDFNLRLAKRAKELGIKVLYFIPPKVWAWRKGRTRLLRAYTDSIACIFPHEEKFLHEHGAVQATFVGHPFSGDSRFTSPPMHAREAVCRSLQLNPSKPLALFLPGSRRTEIKNHTEVVFAGLALAKKQIPDLQCIISVAPTIARDTINIPFDAPWIQISDISSIDLMKIADFGIIKSGTSTLEATFVGVPFTCVFKASKIAEAIVRSFSLINCVSLPNLIRPDSIVELIQNRFTPEEILDEILHLNRPDYRDEIKARLHAVVDALRSKNAYENTADLGLNLLK